MMHAMHKVTIRFINIPPVICSILARNKRNYSEEMEITSKNNSGGEDNGNQKIYKK